MSSNKDTEDNRSYYSEKEMKRMEASILLVLYENYPIGIPKDEIMKKILEKGLLDMTDQEFEAYKQVVIDSKEN